jgi:hypothetical protein
MLVRVGNNGEQEYHRRSSNLKNNSDEYLAWWYIGVAKKRGWPAVVKLLAQYPEKEERIKQLIKKKLGK